MDATIIPCTYVTTRFPVVGIAAGNHFSCFHPPASANPDGGAIVKCLDILVLLAMAALLVAVYVASVQ